MSSSFNINVDNNLTFSNDDNSTLSVAAVSGTDTAGKNLTIAAGQGTGTGTGGSIIFQTADGSGSSGSSANVLATAMTIADDGNIGIGTTSPGTLLQLEGATPYLTLKNSTSQNGEGECESKIIFEDHSDTTLAQIQASHDGTSDDTKGDLIFSTHTGSSLTEAMRIDSSGNVGIRATSPECHLQISGNASEAFSIKSNSAETKIWAHSDGKSYIQTEGDLFIKADGIGSIDNPTMYLKSNGNVGIGTDSPSTKLHLLSGATDDFITFTSGGYNHSIGMYYNQLTLNAHGNATYGTIDFNINNGSTLGMRLNANGYLGIGTNDPKARLHVKSSATNISGGLGSFNDVSLILANSSDDNCALAMHESDYALAFHFRDSSYGGTYVERGYIKGNQSVGQIDFTGQHKSLMNLNIDTTKIGLIVSATNNHINIDNSIVPKINESLPYCVLSNIDNDKKVFGVISDKEDTNTSREYSTGNFVSVYGKTNTNEQRLYINSVGEGAIWVCKKNGTLDNGDYITSTSVPGYGGKQILEPNRLMNYTVAKITCDCDFSLTKIPKQKLKTRTVTETLQRVVYEDITETEENTEIVFDETLNRYIQRTTTTEVTNQQAVKDTHDLYDDEGNIIGTHETDRMENYDVNKTEIDYDANGDPQFEDDLDENGNQQMVYPLETRFLQADGTLLTDEADYNTRLANGEEVYIACFVGCTYHCG